MKTNEDEIVKIAQRIAAYLQLNGFINLKDAAAKGWGDISPLKEGPLERGPKKKS